MAYTDPLLLITSVASILGANSLGTMGTDLFIQYAPKAPINCICVYHTGGFNSVGDPMRSPTFTIQVRNTHVNSAVPKVQAIFNLLNDKWNLLTGITGRLACQTEPGGYFLDSTGAAIYPLPMTFITADPR